MTNTVDIVNAAVTVDIVNAAVTLIIKASVLVKRISSQHNSLVIVAIIGTFNHLLADFSDAAFSMA
jgi:hypothetical protein